MTRRTLLIVAFVVFSFAGVTQSQAPATGSAAPEYKIPDEARNQANPVKATPESIAKGKKIYGYDCAVCHGKDGDGKGDMPEMKNITNFTDPASLKSRTDGEIFYVIQKGKGEMPAEGGRAKSDDVWNMVNYVRSLSKPKS
jgi:mono/diheme cytochrome c family protein